MKKHLLFFLLASCLGFTSCYTVNEPQPEAENPDEIYVNTLLDSSTYISTTGSNTNSTTNSGSNTGTNSGTGTGTNTNPGTSSILGKWSCYAEYNTNGGAISTTPLGYTVTETYLANGTRTLEYSDMEGLVTTSTYVINGTNVSSTAGGLTQTMKWKISDGKLYIYEINAAGAEEGLVYTRIG